MSSSKQPMYLNLLFKALKADIVPSRVKAFVKRIIQVAGMHQPPFICGTFYMISEVRNGKRTPEGLSAPASVPELGHADNSLELLLTPVFCEDYGSLPEHPGDDQPARRQ